MSNATNSEDRLESILDQVRVLKAKYDERAEVTGENFNVFSILDRESDEVKTHSAIIAELLNPRGSHSQGTLFLKIFLEKLPKEERQKLKCGEGALSDEYLKKFEVGVEVSFEKKDEKGKMKRSQIDILIESGDICIVIENKIYAEDQERQLGRYYEYALDTGKEHSIIYLTLEGDEPEDFTLYGNEPDKIPDDRKLPENTVVCLPYREFIVTWVDDCIKEVARIPQIRETLHQYQILLKKLTGQPINWRDAMALKNILLDKDENYNLISELETAISEAKFDLKFKFWTELEEQLNMDLRYELYKKNLEVEKKVKLKACITEGSTQSYPGLTFRLSGDENCEIVFRIECGPKHLYYGFVLCEIGKDLRVKIDKAKHEKYPYLKHLKQHGKDDEWNGDSINGWLAYKYSKYPVIDFKDYKSVKEYEKDNQKFVEKLVAEITAICDDVKRIS